MLVSLRRGYQFRNVIVAESAALDIKKELSTPKLLICPADSGKEELVLNDWSNFRPGMESYQLFLTGEKDEFIPNRILAKCPFHQNVGLSDGSVQHNPTGLPKVNGRFFDPKMAKRYGIEIESDALERWRNAPYREVMIDGRLTLVPNDKRQTLEP